MSLILLTLEKPVSIILSAMTESYDPLASVQAAGPPGTISFIYGLPDTETFPIADLKRCYARVFDENFDDIFVPVHSPVQRRMTFVTSGVYIGLVFDKHFDYFFEAFICGFVQGSFSIMFLRI